MLPSWTPWRERGRRLSAAGVAARPPAAPPRGGGGGGGGPGLGQVTSDFLCPARPFHQGVPDFKSHRFKLATHLMIPKAQHLDSLLGEELVSLLVSDTLVGETVSASVEFHRKLRQRAVEIEVVDAARILATEFEFIEATVAEQAPQAFLGISAFLAELAGEVTGGGSAGAMFAVLCPLHPSPGPPPRRGRGEFARFAVVAGSHRPPRFTS